MNFRRGVGNVELREERVDDDEALCSECRASQSMRKAKRSVGGATDTE